ncbi:MAG: hypothetical protein CL847_04910 [Crocinitomicaceae bacterium]|nr:hypothetical protein [Crocinitomicaceae bacterium]
MTMDKLYGFIWKYKMQILCLSLLFILACVIKLKDFKIYFESERIIKELTTESFTNRDAKNLNNENIFLATIRNNNKYEYEDFLHLKDQINEIKKLKEIKRVFSILNEKTISKTSVFPIPRNKLSLRNKDTFKTTIDSTSSFISNDKKSILILFETNPDFIKSPEHLLDSISIILEEKDLTINYAGRVPSEIYFQEKVSKEFILLAILSAMFCLTAIYYYTKNIAILFMSFCCVLMTILVSTAMSLFLFGGIELFMIISPAIFFIVTVSDIMHLVNSKHEYNDKKERFLNRLKEVGKPVLITSFTTMISFFSFVLIDITPLSHFGIITGLGIMIALFFSVLSYAFIVNHNYDKIRPALSAKRLIHNFIELLQNQKMVVFPALVIAFVFSCIKINDVKIDNYLLDELNPSSEFYQTSKYIDDNFGGIKPISISVDPKSKNFNKNLFKKLLNKNGINVDFSNDNKQNKVIYKYLFQDSSEVYKYDCRIGDNGSNQSNKIYNNIQEFDKQSEIKFSGIGHLFDKTSDGLTFNLLMGLFLAIITVGIFLCLAYGFNIKMFFVGIIPNIIPLILTLGLLLYVTPFYLCLSNAFIFTVAFGLIIDDSIHVINAFMHFKKMGYRKEEIIKRINTKTANTILKTTTIVIVCLVPLFISEFKSVSQIALLTSIASIFAIIFDLGVLPTILNKFID